MKYGQNYATIRRPEVCLKCAGRGVILLKCIGTKKGRKGTVCPDCGGKGNAVSQPEFTTV